MINSPVMFLVSLPFFAVVSHITLYSRSCFLTLFSVSQSAWCTETTHHVVMHVIQYHHILIIFFTIHYKVIIDYVESCILFLLPSLIFLIFQSLVLVPQSVSPISTVFTSLTETQIRRKRKMWYA